MREFGDVIVDFLIKDRVQILAAVDGRVHDLGEMVLVQFAVHLHD